MTDVGSKLSDADKERVREAVAPLREVAPQVQAIQQQDKPPVPSQHDVRMWTEKAERDRAAAEKVATPDKSGYNRQPDMTRE